MLQTKTPNYNEEKIASMEKDASVMNGLLARFSIQLSYLEEAVKYFADTTDRLHTNMVENKASIPSAPLSMDGNGSLVELEKRINDLEKCNERFKMIANRMHTLV